MHSLLSILVLFFMATGASCTVALPPEPENIEEVLGTQEDESPRLLLPQRGKRVRPHRRRPCSNASFPASDFGAIVMIDNPLTVAPETSLWLVGRTQGFYSTAGKEELTLLMAMSLEFEKGTYNGSTIMVFGRNAVLSSMLEMLVLGGSGLFRLPHGYRGEDIQLQ